MSNAFVRTETDEDGIAVVVIDRQDKLNALNADVIAALGDTFAALRGSSDVRGVILTGAGNKAFVAGADIAELAEMDPLSGIRVSRAGQQVFRAIEQMPRPVIAAVNGFALGGGLELALACHLRTASSRARFGLPEVKLGIIPGYGGTIRLPRLVGRARAIEMILTGDMIDAAEAHRIGLVNHVHEPDVLLDETRALMTRMLANGPIALALALESIDHAAATHPDAAAQLESDLFGLLAGTGDMREGMRAFLEKRPAQFTGR